jgi:membrane protein involved in colicin uptake
MAIGDVIRHLVENTGRLYTGYGMGRRQRQVEEAEKARRERAEALERAALALRERQETNRERDRITDNERQRARDEALSRTAEQRHQENTRRMDITERRISETSSRAERSASRAEENSSRTLSRQEMSDAVAEAEGMARGAWSRAPTRSADDLARRIVREYPGIPYNRALGIANETKPKPRSGSRYSSDD